MSKYLNFYRIIAVLILLFITNFLSGQAVDGDYRTRSGGDWNDNTTWQVRNSGSWNNCGAGDYPGASSGAGRVTIRNNHSVNITANITNSLGELRIAGGNQDTYIIFDGAYSLTVDGLTNIRSNSNWDYKAIHVDDGIFRTGSLTLRSSSNSQDAFIRIDDGEVTVDGVINLRSTGLRTYILFTGDGELNVNGSISGGNITSTNNGNTNAPTSGTVIYNGSAAQTFGNYIYYNLTINNSNGISLNSDITVNNILTMTDGNIITGSNTLFLDNGTSANLSYSSGTIIGSFKRAIENTATEYLFPVGSASNYNPIKTTFSNLSSGDLTASFKASDIGSAGLPAVDNTLEVDDTYSTGYWRLIASGSLSSNNYDINLNYTGFSSVSTIARILKRTAGGNLSFNGTHGTVNSPEITRTGLSGISTNSSDFAIGQPHLSIRTQPNDYSGCAPVFTILATGEPTVNYRWQEDSGSGFSDITNGGIYSGATSATLSISAIPAMTGNQYRCIVSDGNSDTETSNSATLSYSLPEVNLGYNYSMPLTLATASGSSDLSDFPVLISLTNNLLRTESNGGHTLSNSGYDIIFTDINDNRLDHELEHYNASTGEYVAWVRIPLLSASGSTTIKMKYGNQSVSTDPSKESVWTSAYKGVWHLNGTDYSDATQYSNDGTNSNTSNITGKIAGGRGFNGSSYIRVTTNGFVPVDNNQTISLWSNYTSTPSGTQNLISFQNASTSSAIQVGFRGGNTVAWRWFGTILANGGSAPSSNTWHYYVYTYDGTHSHLYIDGVEVASSTVAPQTGTPSEGNIGRYNSGEYFRGNIDEVRFSMSPKSTGWIQTEYNNQNNTAAFITVGSETNNSVLTTIGACSSAYTLDQGYPAGGSYSGTGVNGTNFNASTAGVGTHLITYSYTDGDGCTNSASKNIIVTTIPGAPVAGDKECCVSNILDMEATGTNLNWYSDAGLTTLVGTGNPFASGQTAAGTYTYYVTQTVNGCESSATEVDLIVHNSIVINTQPATSTICEGNNADFTIDASGFNLSYQWQENGSDISDGGIYSGTNTAVLSLTDPGLVSSGNTYRCVLSSTCGGSTLTSNSATLTVNPLPVATFSYAGSPYCPTDPDPLPTFCGGGVAGTFSSTAGLVFINTTTGQVDLSASAPNTYTVTNTIAAAGECSEVIATSNITIIAGEIWTGAVSTDWNTAANWSCSYIPLANTDIQIPNVANKPVLSSGAIARVADLSIDPGASLTIIGNTIQISGSVTNNGIFTASAGSVEFNGTLAQVIPAGLFENNTILDLIIDNAAGVTLSGPLSLTGILYPQNGDFASGGNLTLASDASGTALIEGSGSGTVSGSVTMQRYLPERFGYKYFSSPFQAATVNEYADDIDLSFWYPTIFKYDESRTSSGWVDYSNPAGVLEPLSGYTLNFGAVLSADTLDISGVVNNGALSVTLYNNNNTYTKGLNLVGNPYPSPIDWDAVSGWTKTNIDNAIYFFKSSTIDEYGGTYASYINGISSDGQVSNIIPSMQGFFIHVSDGVYPVTASFGMNNNVRITDKTHGFSKSKYLDVKSKSYYPYLRLAAAYEDDEKSEDPSIIYFHPFATENYDTKQDALKLLNTDFSVANLYSLLSDGRKLSINSMPETLEFPYRFPLGLKTNRNGNVVFSIKDSDLFFADYNIWLYDAVKGSSQRLFEGNNYSVELEAGEYHNRFYLDIASMATDIPGNEYNKDLFRAYMNGKILKVDIYRSPEARGYLTIMNLNGQIIKKYTVMSEGHNEYNLSIEKGIYFVIYNSGREIKSRKLIIGN